MDTWSVKEGESSVGSEIGKWCGSTDVSVAKVAEGVRQRRVKVEVSQDDCGKGRKEKNFLRDECGVIPWCVVDVDYLKRLVFDVNGDGEDIGGTEGVGDVRCLLEGVVADVCCDFGVRAGVVKDEGEPWCVKRLAVE